MMCVTGKIKLSAGGCEPVQEPPWSNTQCNPGRCRTQLSLSASQLLLHMLFRLRDQDLVAPHGMKILLSGLQAEKGWPCLV